MKIGILTFNWAINYGAVLQMYAEYNYLNNKFINDEIFIINYIPDELSDLYKIKIFNNPFKIKLTIKEILRKIIKQEQYGKFEKFIKKNMILTKAAKNRKDLINIIDNLDMVVVGSDQVWNYDITKKFLKDYLLYDINCNKISYAASIGKNEIKNEVKPLFKKSLREFDYVSVREKSSADYLKKICKRDDYKVCIDPVFLLTKKEWENIAEKSDYNLLHGEYILVYMLEYNSHLVKVANYLSNIYNVPVVSIEIPFLRFKGMKGIKKLHNVGPLDFVKLFLNAKYILTNSFHGTAFSLIFNKRFISFAHSTVNLRIESLLKLYGLENMQIINNINVSDNYVDKILESSQLISNNEINKVIDLSKRYLCQSIEEIKNKRG